MEKENKKLREKHLKKERSRIIKLVETAYNKDPRIRKMKEEEEAAKVILILLEFSLEKEEIRI